MIERTIARPIPIPFDLVVKKASKSPWHDLGIDALPGAEPRFGCAPFRANLHVSPPTRLTRPVSAVADRIKRIQDDESYVTGQRTRLH